MFPILSRNACRNDVIRSRRRPRDRNRRLPIPHILAIAGNPRMVRWPGYRVDLAALTPAEALGSSDEKVAWSIRGIHQPWPNPSPLNFAVRYCDRSLRLGRVPPGGSSDMQLSSRSRIKPRQQHRSMGYRYQLRGTLQRNPAARVSRQMSRKTSKRPSDRFDPPGKGPSACCIAKERRATRPAALAAVYHVLRD